MVRVFPEDAAIALAFLPLGADGTTDLAPGARLFIKENEIVAKLYQGIQDLMKEENAA